MLLQIVDCCIALVVPSIPIDRLSIKKLIFRPCASFRYIARKYIDTKNAKGEWLFANFRCERSELEMAVSCEDL